MNNNALDTLAGLGRALSDPARVRILDALRGGELCVCELTDALEMGQSTLSSHLQVVRGAGLVATRKQGRWMYYRLERAALPLLSSVFAWYGPALDTDPRLLRDRERARKRLKLRVNGCCVVSTAQLENDAKGGEQTMEINTTTAACGCDCGCCTSGDCCCGTGCC